MTSPKNKFEDSEQHLWERGWEAHEQAQLLRLAKLSFPEKLAWLEEAHRVVRQMTGPATAVVEQKTIT